MNISKSFINAQRSGIAESVLLFGWKNIVVLLIQIFHSLFEELTRKRQVVQALLVLLALNLLFFPVVLRVQAALVHQFLLDHRLVLVQLFLKVVLLLLELVHVQLKFGVLFSEQFQLSLETDILVFLAVDPLL